MIARPICLALLLAGNVHAQAPRWTAVQDLRIGAVDDPQYGFSPITMVLAGRDGSIWVSQRQEQAIRVFDADGRFLRLLGGQGAGPGEFEGLIDIGWQGDTLFATDFRNRRVTLFAADGSLAGDFTLNVQLRRPLLGSTPSSLLADGTALMVPSVAVAAIAAGQIDRRPGLHVDRFGVVLDTVMQMPIDAANTVIEHGGRRFGVRPLLSDGSLYVATSRDWVVLERPAPTSGEDATFRLIRIAPDGDTLLDRSYRYTPVEVTDTQRDSLLIREARRRAPRAGSLGITQAELLDLLRAHVQLPRWMPGVTAVVVSHEGDVWVRAEDRFTGEVRWHVLDSRGAVIGAVPLPSHITVHSVRGDAIYATETDALDVPYVVRYRVR